MSDPSKGRIAIKLGPATTSKPTPSPRAPPPTTLGKRPRQTLVLGDASDDSDSDTDAHHGRHEEITAFGRDGAETDRKRRAAERVKKEYVIAKQPNRDWRTEMRARRQSSRNLLPEEARQQQQQQQQQQQNGGPAAVETQPADQDGGLRWGLTLPESKDDTNDEQQPAAAAAAAAQEPPHLTAAADPPKPRSADDEALDALLGNKTGPGRTIAAPSEDDVYKRDAAEAGAASTLDDYEAMPVEEFGAALLRGMGWDGEPTGPKVKEVRRRPNRLGLGAKELKDAEDLGGWNQNGNKGRPRPRLADYRREERKKKESRGREDSYKRERERERERGGSRDRERERDRNRDRDRYRDERRDRDRDSHRDRRR